MGLKTGVFLLGAGILAACEPVAEGAMAVGSDGYFATNIGRRAGQAEALAASCPSITMNEATVQAYKKAICAAREQDEGCSLPSFESEQQRLYGLTKASLASLSAEQACAYTRAEVLSDGTLSSFLLGAVIAPVAAVRPAAPAAIESDAPVEEIPGPV